MVSNDCNDPVNYKKTLLDEKIRASHSCSMNTIDRCSRDHIVVQGYCGSFPVNFLIDTGANVSLVASRIIFMLNLTSMIKPAMRIIKGIDNEVIPTRGQIELKITVGGVKKSGNFLICDDMDTDFLTGMDINNALGMVINLRKKSVSFPNGRNEKFLIVNRIKERTKVRNCKTITLKPNTVSTIQSFLSNSPRNEAQRSKCYEGEVEPYYTKSVQKGFIVTGTLSLSHNNTLLLHIINPTDKAVTIYKNQLLAFFNPIGPKIQPRHVRKLDSYDASIDLERLPMAPSIEETIKAGKWEDPEPLFQKLRIDSLQIPMESKEELRKLVAEYSHVFSKTKHDLGRCSFYEANLRLKHDFTPKWVPTRPVSYKTEPHLNEVMENLESSGQIVPCNYSLWNNPVFMVPKSNGQYRFVMDARALNSQCVRDNYQLPRINNIMDKLVEGEWWSSLDLTSSFTQIGLKKRSQHLTAFTFAGRRMQWCRMIQGHTNSSSEFSRMINQLFERVPFNSLLIYIDDLLLASKSVDEHIRRLKFILQRLEWGNLKLSPTKTSLLQKEATFLGYKVSRNGIKIDPDKTRAISNLPAPHNVKQVQKLLGMLNWHRSHIPNFATLAAPLYHLLNKNIKFEWSKSCERSFQLLKDAMVKAPILGFPDYEDIHQSYELTTDSSKIGHGAVLTQLSRDGKTRRVISYFSKTVPKSMRRHGATKLELIGLLAAMKHWEIYLGNNQFVVKTDCKALLQWETIYNKENSFVQRRIADLAGMRFKIIHVSGESQDIKLADYLSRYGTLEPRYKSMACQTVSSSNAINFADGNNCHDPDPASSNNKTVIDDPVSLIARVSAQTDVADDVPVTREDLKNEYQSDIILRKVISWLKNKKRPEKLTHGQTHLELYHYWKNFDLLHMKDGLLYMKRTVFGHKTHRRSVLVVPHTLYRRILYTFHNSRANCHSGVDNSYDQCRKKFYFYKMRREFELWINACLTCNKTKQCNATLKAPLKPILYHHFGQAISIDHLEPSKKATRRGITALLTITDMYSGYLVCVPVKSQSAEETIKNIVEHWILKIGGIPAAIHHDRGAGFTSALFMTVLRVFGIKDKPGTSFHSQTQGKVEAQNRRLNMCLRAVLDEDQWNDYDLHVKYVVFALNALKSSKTGYSANFLAFGRELTMPRDLFVDDKRLEELYAADPSERKLMAPYQLYASIRSLTRGVMHTAEKRAEYMCTEYDKKIKGPYFNEGDSCFILVNCPKHKYADKWVGPFVILSKINDHNYVIKVNGEEKVVNISKMKLYKPNKYSPVTTTSPQLDPENTKKEVESYPIHYEERTSSSPPGSSQPQKSRHQDDSNPMDSIPISDDSHNDSDDDQGGNTGPSIIRIPDEPEVSPPDPPDTSPMETGQVDNSSSPMETEVAENAGQGTSDSSPMEASQDPSASGTSPTETFTAEEPDQDPGLSEPPPMETVTINEPTPNTSINERTHDDSSCLDTSFESAVSEQEEEPTSPTASVSLEDNLNSLIENDDTFTESPENQPRAVPTGETLSQDVQPMATTSSDRLISLPEIDQHRTPTGGTVSNPSNVITRASGAEDLSNLGRPGGSRSPIQLRPRPTRRTPLFQSLSSVGSNVKSVIKKKK